jgi:gluconolactonase
MKLKILLAVAILELHCGLLAGGTSGASSDGVAIDLATDAGVALVKGQWRYSDARIIEAGFLAAGPDGQPGSTPAQTYDFTPHAGGVDFDDSGWEIIAPTALIQRRGNGRLSFNWYRITVTVPETIGSLNSSGSTITFSTSVDDYAEIWVDGELTRAAGQTGGSVVAGWNAENRLVIGRNVTPGQRIQLAIFGINGPLSNPPTNYIYLREARLEFTPGGYAPVAVTPAEVNVEVERIDHAINDIVPLNPKIIKLAEGFRFTEGPVWLRDSNALLFSDPNSNVIFRYEEGTLTVFREQSGYSGADIASYGQPGSNGLTLDPQGRLTINQHGNHRVVRLEADGRETVLADAFQGKRLNSPNDLVYRSDGTLFFTDPPFGLPKFFDDPRKELPFSGVYSIANGKLRLLTKEFSGPNGIALSPDEKYLYVGNWDDRAKVVKRFEVGSDGTLSNGTLFYDFTNSPGKEAIDGIKVDQRGNLYVSAPGGLWVLSPEGKHLGTIITPKHVHNMAWGDRDGKALYLCAQGALYRMRLNIPGAGLDQSRTGTQ